MAHRDSNFNSQIPRPSNFGFGGSQRNLASLPFTQLNDTARVSNVYRAGTGAGGRPPLQNHGRPFQQSLCGATPLLQKFEEAGVSGFSSSQQSQLNRYGSNSSIAYGHEPRTNQPLSQRSARGVDQEVWNDKAHQREAARIMFDFLDRHGFKWDSEKKKKTHLDLLRPIGPTRHDFMRMFEFILSKYFGSYTLPGLDPKTGKPNLDEVVKQVKYWAETLGYRHFNQLTKSVIGQPNQSDSTWIEAFRFLHWLREEAEMWFLLSRPGTENPLYNIFFQPVAQGETDLNKIFYQLRMEFMVEVYRRNVKTGSTDYQDLLDDFRDKLYAHVSTEADPHDYIQRVSAELDERQQRLKERQEKYMSLEKIQAETAALERKAQQREKEIKELQAVNSNREKAVIDTDHKLKTVEDGNKDLEREIAEYESRIRKQPMKREQKRAMENLRQQHREAAAAKSVETDAYVSKIREKQTIKAQHVKKLRDLTAELRAIIAEMNVGLSIDISDQEEIPNYSDHTDVQEFIATIRRIIDHIATKVRQSTVDVEQKKKMTEEDIKRTMNQIGNIQNTIEKAQKDEARLKEELEDLDRQLPDVSHPALEEEIETIRKRLQVANNLKLKLIEDLARVDKEVAKKMKGYEMVKQLLEEHKIAGAELMRRYESVQQERKQTLEKRRMKLLQVTEDFRKQVISTQKEVLQAAKGFRK